MLKFINLKKLTAKSLFGILVIGSFIAGTSDKKAVAACANDNNGHGNNAPFTHQLATGKLTIGHYDPSNPGTNRSRLIADLDAGLQSPGLNSNRPFDIKFVGNPGVTSYNLTSSEATAIVNAHPDWEIKSNTTEIESGCGDRDSDSVGDDVELGSNFNLPLDSDDDGKFNYADTDSDNDGIDDIDDDRDRDSDGDGVSNYIDSTNNKHNSRVNDDTMGVEVRYFNSAFQCYGGAPLASINVKVWNKNKTTLLATLSKGQSYKSTTIDSIADLRFTFQNLTCTSYSTAKGVKLLGPDDSVPTVGGWEDQESIGEMLDDLNSYEELYLVELGSSDRTSPYYDLQDVVLVVDNNPLPPNNPPTAVNDLPSTPYGTPVDIDVLANDTDPDAGQTLTIDSVTTPSSGTTQIVNGKVRYTPNSNFNTAGGPDSFTYTIKDTRGATASATVNVSVGAKPNGAPNALADTIPTPYGAPVEIDVLANDRDPEGQTLTIDSVTTPSSGTTEIVNGKVRYTPNSNFNTAGGSDSFSYTVKDPQGATGSANVTVNVAEKPGTDEQPDDGNGDEQPDDGNGDEQPDDGNGDEQPDDGNGGSISD
jgi:Bacterial Ig domain